MTMKTGQWFAILPKLGGAVSLISSSLVIRDICKKTYGLGNPSGTMPALGRANEIPLISAITLAKSIICCIFSFFGPLMSTWMAPRGEAFYAYGTRTTCEVQGFIATFSIVSFVSYFVTLVGVRMNSNCDFKRTRRLILFIPIVIGLAAAMIPLINGSYNFSGVYSCSISPYPLGCGPKSGIPCIRGEHAKRTVSFITFTFNAVAYIVAFWGYYTELKRTDTYIFNVWPAATMNFAFYLSFIAGVVVIFSHGTASARLVAFYVSVILTPLTGFFMAMIYYYASRKVPRDDEDNSMSFTLSEPLIKNGMV